MTEKWCGLCQRKHFYQATPEISAPRRETPRDFWIAALTWGIVAAAYVSAFIWTFTR